MDLLFNTSLAEGYHSPTQRARVMSEAWFRENVYCPRCGRAVLAKYDNNRPVADFFCEDCREDYELKSKENSLGQKIPDGAYNTMVARIRSLNNPNFFFLRHVGIEVRDLFVVPSFFFTPTIIEKRKPLAPTARRAGWVGCNIEINELPEYGKIFLVREGECVDKSRVVDQFARAIAFKTDSLDTRGWVFDVMKCIDRIRTDDFTLDQVYVFGGELKARHPDNNFINAKIRQQLQVLRDRGVIEFTSRGHYRKIK